MTARMSDATNAIVWKGNGHHEFSSSAESALESVLDQLFDHPRASQTIIFSREELMTRPKSW
jgi:hypothetical protein